HSQDCLARVGSEQRRFGVGRDAVCADGPGRLSAITEVTRILSANEHGDPQAAEQLLPLVYDELRSLAAQKLAQEKPGQTLEATALVHEAYLRLVGHDNHRSCKDRGHFFAAAAQGMRRILVDNARRKRSKKRGDGLHRQPLEAIAAPE